MELVLSSLQWLALLPPVFLCVLFYLYTILWLRPERLRQKLRSQGVKGPKPSFLFGNIPEMRRIQQLAKSDREQEATTSDWFSSNYVATLFPYFLHWSRIYGSIYLYSTGSIQAVNVTDPDIVKELANCKSLDLGKPCYLQKERGALLGMGILTSNGDLWVHQRKVIAPEFFMDKVKGMVNLMMEAALSMLNSWETEIESEGGSAEIVVDEFLRNFSADVISRASFGSSFAEGKEIFIKIRQLQTTMAKQSMLIGVPGSSNGEVMAAVLCHLRSRVLRAQVSGRVGLRNSVRLCTCTGRRAIKFLGSASARLLNLRRLLPGGEPFAGLHCEHLPASRLDRLHRIGHHVD